MTTTPETRPCLIFNPPAMDGPSGDLELVSAIFRAALQIAEIAEIADVRRAPLGDIVIALPHDLYYRARTTVVAGSAKSLLDWMLENHPGVGAVVAKYPGQPEVDPATKIKEPLGGRHEQAYEQDERRLRAGQMCGPRGELAIRAMAREVLIDRMRSEIEAMEEWRNGAAALAREGLVEVGAAQGPGEFFKALRAELGQLREDLRVEEGKVARLTEELARLNGTGGAVAPGSGGGSMATPGVLAVVP